MEIQTIQNIWTYLINIISILILNNNIEYESLLYHH